MHISLARDSTRDERPKLRAHSPRIQTLRCSPLIRDTNLTGRIEDRLQNKSPLFWLSALHGGRVGWGLVTNECSTRGLCWTVHPLVVSFEAGYAFEIRVWGTVCLSLRARLCFYYVCVDLNKTAQWAWMGWGARYCQRQNEPVYGIWSIDFMRFAAWSFVVRDGCAWTLWIDRERVRKWLKMRETKC